MDEQAVDFDGAADVFTRLLPCCLSSLIFPAQLIVSSHNRIYNTDSYTLTSEQWSPRYPSSWYRLSLAFLTIAP